MTQDTITILRSKGPLMTKVWQADGTIKGYDRAKNFKVMTSQVGGVQDLSGLLTEIENTPTMCVIRGQAKDGVDLSSTERTLEAFEEVPRRWVCIDVDNYQPILANPVTEPGEAVDEFIRACLPAEFHGAAHHWQLSSSAGKLGAEGTLKAHIWFWLSEPRGQHELEGWARGLQLPVDVTVFRTVQVHYTAAPVIEDGAFCPVTQRSGFVGGRPEVDLVISDAILDTSRRAVKDRGQLKDPTAKTGVIGAFCRHYSPARVIDDDLVEGAFEWQDDSDVRITWKTSSSGSAGGVCITDDQLHFFCSHNEDPFEGRAVNAWDFVRVHKFGELDDHIDPDARDWLMSTGGMPSHRAMIEFALSLPEVAEELGQAEQAKEQDKQEKRQAKAVAVEQHVLDAQASIAAAPTATELERIVCPAIVDQRSWSDGERERLARAVCDRFRALTGATLPVATARAWLAPPPTTSNAATGAPEWLSRWVYIEQDNAFFSLDTKESLTASAFDTRHTLAMPQRQGSAARESASFYAVHVWGIATAGRTMYAPSRPEVFEMHRTAWANTFDPATVPSTAAEATEEGRQAAKMVESHLRRMFPDPREREILVSWLAHVVLKPGVKVGWAPYIWGSEGTGKSMLATLIEKCLGGPNIMRLGGKVLTSDFTGWANGPAVTIIEEARQVGHAYDVPEQLKTAVTEDVVNIHAKGKEPYDKPNFTSYAIFSNHADGIPVTEGDRRYFFLEVALSTEDARSLTEEGFFGRLFDAIRAQPEQLRLWLSEQPVHPEFLPRGRAPLTAARAKVIELCKSEPELLIQDILAGREVVSSSWLARAMRKADQDVKTRTLSKLLTSAGFEPVKERMRIAGVQHRLWARKGTTQEAIALRHLTHWMGLDDFGSVEDEG